MAELIDRIELMRQIAEFGREIPKDQVIGVIARQGSVDCDGDDLRKVTKESTKGEWIPFRDDLLIRENAAEVVGEFFNRMDISLFGRTGVRLARNVLSNVPAVAPLKWIPLNKDGYEPFFKGDYLLCLDDGYITSVYFDGNDWELWADSGEPVAWMPLPESYKGGEDE